MGITLEELEKCFNKAVNEEAEYVAVQIEMDGFPSDEVIINDKHNIDSKLAYYKKTYKERSNSPKTTIKAEFIYNKSNNTKK
ncbi:hypothetical protein [Bacillus cereus]|uniref:Uncharacterized protein n=1 Tax=Bacillus cereus VD048 TaxID=1053226 RepID=J8H9J5_BACCE|nr:hypothetical protein [Bacillus cereus]EJR24433.1 hypothetical protein IIG_06001 [Bacillus cereus VD048]